MLSNPNRPVQRAGRLGLRDGRRLVLLAAGCVLAAACGGGPGGTEPVPRVSELRIEDVEGDSLSVAVGESRTFSVHALDAAGQEVVGAPFEASSSNPVVASVSVATPASGPAALASASIMVRGQAAGSTTITVRHPPTGVTADLPITVTEPPAPVIQLVSSSISFVVIGNDLNLPPQVVSVTNAGGGILHWSASADSSWLNVTPSSGTGGGPLSLALDPSSLRLLCPGTFDPCTDPRQATVTVSAPGAEPKTIDVNLTFAPAPPPPPPDVVVLVGNGTRTFVPAQLTIRRGTRVIWRWNDNEQHSVTRNSLTVTFLGGPPDPLFDSGILRGPGREFSRVFNETPRTFRYHCHGHSLFGDETGTITITE
jgi:plastocyanin